MLVFYNYPFFADQKIPSPKTKVSKEISGNFARKCSGHTAPLPLS